MRECVRNNHLTLTIHAIEEMNYDDLEKVDIEQCIFTGDIVERQWDVPFQCYKYRIEGLSTTNDPMEVVAKLNDENTLIITTYIL